MPPEVPIWAEPLFHELGKPRLAGSEQVAEAENAIEACMRHLGFSVTRQSFRTSPRRLFAGSLLGAGCGWVALGLVPLMVLPVQGWMVTVVGFSGLATVFVVTFGIATGALPFDARIVDASNLIATRGAPRIWFVAHSDSKGQWLSLRGRVFATAAFATGVMFTVGVLLFRLSGPTPWVVSLPPLLLLLAGGAFLSRAPLHGESPGAVDNGSGVIAALRAAEVLSDRQDIGVLITGAEEFGMEGARAWIRSDGLAGSAFVNFDGIDAVGQFNVMTHHASSGPGAPFPASAVHTAICEALCDRGHAVRKRPLPFGVFVDGSILAKGGLPGVTVSRGTWHTLSVIHTPADRIDRTNCLGALEAGAAAAQATRHLLG